ncbi:2'-5' RNA ligase family protein [Hymenobacter aerilatus]|uniref:2'-5' RNA ligase family protein n=1 Tax=Hymenobacter aerilatus TaxID=2932251 RepID=A0A8T9SZQ9_9BACT|nr:2'-5' RNA ligase family protein [Hymenobacter aerilatus]UOR07107.1 2'-5' RNA ligase family protein [Hymenobacter aerilatus]
MPPTKPLYLVALLLPEPALSEVWALKQEVHQRTGSRNAVRLPPHITLIPPLRQSPNFEQKARQALAAFAATQQPCRVGVRDFAWFGNRTLFVRVSDDAEVRALHADLQTWCAAQLPEVPRETRPFTPHITLTTRDLPPEQVAELQALFAARSYAATFQIEALQLFCHDGQQWQLVQTFALTAA